MFWIDTASLGHIRPPDNVCCRLVKDRYSQTGSNTMARCQFDVTRLVATPGPFGPCVFLRHSKFQVVALPTSCGGPQQPWDMPLQAHSCVKLVK